MLETSAKLQLRSAVQLGSCDLEVLANERAGRCRMKGYSSPEVRRLDRSDSLCAGGLGSDMMGSSCFRGSLFLSVVCSMRAKVATKVVAWARHVGSVGGLDRQQSNLISSIERALVD